MDREDRRSDKCLMPNPDHCGRSPATMTLDYLSVLEHSSMSVAACCWRFRLFVCRWRFVRLRSVFGARVCVLFFNRFGCFGKLMRCVAGCSLLSSSLFGFSLFFWREFSPLDDCMRILLRAFLRAPRKYICTSVLPLHLLSPFPPPVDRVDFLKRHLIASKLCNIVCNSSSCPLEYTHPIPTRIATLPFPSFAYVVY